MTDMTTEQYMDTLPASYPARLATHMANYYTTPEGSRIEELCDLLAADPENIDLIEEAEELIRFDADQD